MYIYRQDVDSIINLLAGVLCHFEDQMLKGQYFIDPQWLSDQLAKVVSAQEIKNIATDGEY